MMCATTLFPWKDGKHRFRPSWLAREAEIKILALRGQDKKGKARRLETLQDATLCKNIALSQENLCTYNTLHKLAFRIRHPVVKHSIPHDEDNTEGIESKAPPPRLLQCELRRKLFRHHIRKLRTCLLYTSPSPRDRTRSRMPSSA